MFEDSLYLLPSLGGKVELLLEDEAPPLDLKNFKGKTRGCLSVITFSFLEGEVDSTLFIFSFEEGVEGDSREDVLMNFLERDRKMSLIAIPSKQRPKRRTKTKRRIITQLEVIEVGEDPELFPVDELVLSLSP